VQRLERRLADPVVDLARELANLRKCHARVAMPYRAPCRADTWTLNEAEGRMTAESPPCAASRCTLASCSPCACSGHQSPSAIFVAGVGPVRPGADEAWGGASPAAPRAVGGCARCGWTDGKMRACNAAGPCETAEADGRCRQRSW
jgi:hypothetical protein